MFQLVCAKNLPPSNIDPTSVNGTMPVEGQIMSLGDKKESIIKQVVFPMTTEAISWA